MGHLSLLWALGMNLLKQTALVLGLVSLSLGGWALFKNWRQKLAILYAILCFIVAAWALSFVTHATLGGRLSKDIHWFFNIWLAPIGVTIVSKILSGRTGGADGCKELVFLEPSRSPLQLDFLFTGSPSKIGFGSWSAFGLRLFYSSTFMS